MPQHAVGAAPAGGVRAGLVAFLSWHDRRPRASLDDARGWMWVALVAATFFWMSNPTVLIPSFYLALGQPLIWTKVVVVLSLLWIRVPRIPWPWLAFLAVAYLSQLWTINDFHTDVSDIVYLELTVLALVAAANCTPEIIAWGMALGGVWVVALSQLTYEQRLTGAYYGDLDAKGRLVWVFAGVGSNENILAYTMVIALAATIALGVPRRPGPFVVWVLTIGANLYGVYRSGSGTGYLTAVSLVIVGLLVLALPFLRSVPRKILVLSSVLIGALAVAGVLFVTVVLDKDLASVSGRAPFWRAAIETGLAHSPVIGSGWGAVWEHPWDPTPANPVSLEIYARAGYGLVHGHNMFVDVFPELGLVGVLLALCMVGYAVREVGRNGVRAGSRDPLVGRLVLLVLVALLVSGITEPMLTVPIGWWSLALVTALPRQRLLHFWRVDAARRRTRTPRSRGGKRAAR